MLADYPCLLALLIFSSLIRNLRGYLVIARLLDSRRSARNLAHTTCDYRGGQVQLIILMRIMNIGQADLSNMPNRGLVHLIDSSVNN